MARSFSTRRILLRAVFGCAGLLATTHSARAADGSPGDGGTRMTSARYQFQPSKAAIMGGDLDLDVTADPPTRLSNAVAAGRWNDVAAVLAVLPPQQASAVYHQILKSLIDTTAFPKVPDADTLKPDDVLHLADALPAAAAMAPADVAATGQLFSKTLVLAGPTADALEDLKKDDSRFGKGTPAKQTQTAAMLLAAGELGWAKTYLPDDQAVLKANDPALDRVYYRYAVLAAKDADTAGDDATAARLRDVAYRLVLRTMLRPGMATPDVVGAVFQLAYRTNKTQSLLDALRPLVKENGASLRPILASAAAVPPPANTADSVAERMTILRTQADLAGVICETLPADAAADDPRAEALRAFAANWTNEATLSVTQWRDAARPVLKSAVITRQAPPMFMTGDALWTRAPQGKWRDLIHGGLRTAMDRNLVAVAMYLDNTSVAMDLLKDLARTYPLPDDTVGDALTVWAKQHQTVRVDPMQFATGILPSGIPLTKAAQDHNIDALCDLLARIKAIYGRPLPAEPLPIIFDLVSSQAEVYTKTDLERVFGPLNQLDTPMLLRVCNQMFGNLQNDWLFTTVQAASGTGRNENETYDMVIGGYDTLIGLIADRAAQGKDAAIYRELADVQFRYAEVLMALGKGYGPYNTHRAAAFDATHQAMALSAAGDAADAPQTLVKWFYRALGGTKMTDVTSRSVFSDEELGRIKSAIAAMPVSQAAGAREALLDAVRSQLAAIKSDARYRIIQTVLTLAGDDTNARGLRSLTRYYDDLLRDVQFITRVDGTPQVGKTPFGLTLVLRHTGRLERQTRGFGKYVQNQFRNQYRNVNFMPGSPGSVANYRDDLEKGIRRALGPAYDVVSIAWSPSDVNSVDADQPGWRETPLCYVVLKAKDATADRVPPVQIDLDFADQLNEVVLPIRSGAVVVDASHTEPRPAAALTVEQTLNDHDARSGKLELTVSASGTGLMPALDQLIDWASVPAYQVGDLQDTGPLADSYEAVAGGNGTPQLASHRKWVVTLVTKSGTAASADFKFPTLASTAGKADVKYRRYADADIVDAGPDITLAGIAPATGTRAWPWVLAGLALAAVAAGAAFLKRRRKGNTPMTVVAKPTDLDPFRLLTRLQSIHRSSYGLTVDQQGRLAGDIGVLERHYFGDRMHVVDRPDLVGIADRWR